MRIRNTDLPIRSGGLFHRDTRRYTEIHGEFIVVSTLRLRVFAWIFHRVSRRLQGNTQRIYSSLQPCVSATLREIFHRYSRRLHRDTRRIYSSLQLCVSASLRANRTYMYGIWYFIVWCFSQIFVNSYL